MALVFRRARAEDLGALSALCLRSKAHWGYDAAVMRACEAELTLRPVELLHCDVGLAARDGVLVAVAQVDPRAGELDKLFVAPGAMGQGLGRAMMAWAAAAARLRGLHALRIAADPGAEHFYIGLGAERVGRVASGSIPGRFLPLLRLSLT
ncbi:GNAT family N-acetyltransferase [Pseudooceanicola sp. LIPI14-2-Ac024]|uniref:GNAT family N-acetyltransferase n=1 Tax=Pseudooceanicola sp. LIPI14-2-Ac024 TaxID=3344875 RepID=UPI0035CFB495